MHIHDQYNAFLISIFILHTAACGHVTYLLSRCILDAVYTQPVVYNSKLLINSFDFITVNCIKNHYSGRAMQPNLLNYTTFNTTKHFNYYWSIKPSLRSLPGKFQLCRQFYPPTNQTGYQFLS